MEGDYTNKQFIDFICLHFPSEKVIEIASPISTTHAGMGISMNMRIRIRPTANAKSPRSRESMAERALGTLENAGGPAI